MNAHQPMSNRERVARRREKLRADGLRPRQFWLPDMSDPTVVAALHREALSIAASGDDDINFAMSIQYWPPEDE